MSTAQLISRPPANTPMVVEISRARFPLFPAAEGLMSDSGVLRAESIILRAEDMRKG